MKGVPLENEANGRSQRTSPSTARIPTPNRACGLVYFADATELRRRVCEDLYRPLLVGGQAALNRTGGHLQRPAGRPLFQGDSNRRSMIFSHFLETWVRAVTISLSTFPLCSAKSPSFRVSALFMPLMVPQVASNYDSYDRNWKPLCENAAPGRPIQRLSRMTLSSLQQRPSIYRLVNVERCCSPKLVLLIGIAYSVDGSRLTYGTEAIR